ncbi:hypothetical protein GCM10025865_17420 [Paraoerskovia sediminicola]|uniref:VanZ like family protein n=1 Tax=Paraoerskovia sediminicola TaxID=1138587 RepID=A0ABN6XG27_9CELL|nr:hypothetical protein [Paraoerskovia sediminicola]BDZ42443.1 hypothetical protein GCM10025865_17420 [Paraoerskovia sediminicola]
MTRRSLPVWVPILVLLLTVGQLAVAEWWPGIARFENKAFGARLVAYPAMMLLAPALWWVVVKRRDAAARPPWTAFTLIMLPFLIDVTGNSFNLYDTIVWWDDANHYFNWLLLLSGIGVLIAGRIRPRWAQVLLVTGAGAILAILWELGEYLTFIRQGTELDVAYQDTLGDLTLGTLGALTAGFVVWAWSRRATDVDAAAAASSATEGPARTVAE